MRTLRGLFLAALALSTGACVTLNEPVLSEQSVGKGQRTIVLVYPAPGPWVITDSESKAESAAKMLPGLSFAVQSFQDDRYKEASEKLRPYVPYWPARELLEAELFKALPRTRFPGALVPVAEAAVDTTTLRLWNRASDTLDWQNRYLYPDPSAPHPRDYSRLLSWDDALVFEVNVLPQLTADDDGNMVPTLVAASRLLRCQTLRLLWRHEDKADAPAQARSLYEFMTLPQQLLDRWRALVPALAERIAGSLFAALNPGASPGALPAAQKPPSPEGTAVPAATVPVQPPAISTAAAVAVSTAPAPTEPVPAVSTPTVPAQGP
ncbi:MAG: hypothetical protein HY926_15685 [Elusimicrobia bacterium]|nr:hypothetical protein [Elusimicrobiota bacterium]